MIWHRANETAPTFNPLVQGSSPWGGTTPPTARSLPLGWVADDMYLGAYTPGISGCHCADRYHAGPGMARRALCHAPSTMLTSPSAPTPNIATVMARPRAEVAGRGASPPDGRGDS
jgi:hypothetical protein